MRTELLVFAALGCAATLPAPAAGNNSAFIPYEKLQDSPWRIQRWDRRYPLVFLSYGPWSAADRLAYECKRQSLLTPTWDDPKFAHPIESRATEWGWSAEWLFPGCKTKRECYESVNRLYLERIRYWQYPRERGPLIEKGEKFYMQTQQAVYLLCGAEWGCDMAGIETGENIGPSNVLTVFARGAARQTGKPFYVQPSPWEMGTVPLFLPGDDDTTQHQLTEKQLKAAVAHDAGAVLNGGHSSYYLAREWYHAWLSGATVVCPEACQSNFFAGHDEENRKLPQKQTIPLSPIGRRAQEFLALTRKHPDIGVPYTPFALLLDRYCGYTGNREHMPCPWNVLKPALPDWENVLFFESLFPGHMALEFTPELMGRRDENYHVWVSPERPSVPTPYSEGYDALLSSTPLDVLRCYPLVICLGEHEFLPPTVDKLIEYLKHGGRLCLTHQQAARLKGIPQAQATEGGSAFDRLKRAGKVDLYGLKPDEVPAGIDPTRWSRWGQLCVYSPEKETKESLRTRYEATQLLPYEKRFIQDTRRTLGRLCAEYVPVEISGNIQYTVNRTGRGWLVGLFNNDGATKTNITPVVIDPSKTRVVTVRPREANMRSANEWCEQTNVPVRNGTLTVNVPPGEVRIVELVTQDQSRSAGKTSDLTIQLIQPQH